MAEAHVPQAEELHTWAAAKRGDRRLHLGQSWLRVFAGEKNRRSKTVEGNEGDVMDES
jgi:hypothetical protein